MSLLTELGALDSAICAFKIRINGHAAPGEEPFHSGLAVEQGQQPDEAYTFRRLAQNRREPLLQLPEIQNLRAEQVIAAALDQGQTARGCKWLKIFVSPAAQVVRRPLVRV